MITKQVLLDTIRAILKNEREAIERLDAKAMGAASDAKEALLCELHAIPFEERGPFIDALAELQPELRQNMQMLTHAAMMIAEKRRAARAAPTRLAS